MNEVLEMLIEELKRTVKYYSEKGGLTPQALAELTDILRNLQYISNHCER